MDEWMDRWMDENLSSRLTTELTLIPTGKGKLTFLQWNDKVPPSPMQVSCWLTSS